MESRTREPAAAEGKSDPHPTIFDNGVMLIRKATPQDAEVVREIVRDVYVGEGWADLHATPDYVRSLLDAETRIAQADVLVAELDGGIVATITAADEPPFAHVAQPGELEVRMLAVRAQARRHGVAQALVTACEDIARDRGLERVVLSTDPDMHAAQALYEGLGYRRTPGRDWETGGVMLLTYAKPIQTNHG